MVDIPGLDQRLFLVPLFDENDAPIGIAVAERVFFIPWSEAIKDPLVGDLCNTIIDHVGRLRETTAKAAQAEQTAQDVAASASASQMTLAYPVKAVKDSKGYGLLGMVSFD